MAEFYGNGLEGASGSGSWGSSSQDEVPKKSALELALDELQKQLSSLLWEALSLAKSGDPRVQDEIEKKIEMYRRMAPVTQTAFRKRGLQKSESTRSTSEG